MRFSLWVEGAGGPLPALDAKSGEDVAVHTVGLSRQVWRICSYRTRRGPAWRTILSFNLFKQAVTRVVLTLDETLVLSIGGSIISFFHMPYHSPFCRTCRRPSAERPRPLLPWQVSMGLAVVGLEEGSEFVPVFSPDGSTLEGHVTLFDGSGGR